ncbi:MAG: aspartate/glutamate racemase family protein, partial [Mogibacterium sp.]|nr:aspartate/glutamate racemase family protein [Mogibacterium sp.]
DGLSPAEVVETCGLADMVKYMESCGAEAIVLGCTHFPYIREELAKLTDLPLIDPADKMYEALTDK